MTLDQLICLAESHGITISWTHLHTRAAYHHKTRTIYLDHALNTRPRHATAILAHEYIHALMGHTGPQDAHTERLVDLRAAQLLVSPAEYAHAEQLHTPTRTPLQTNSTSRYGLSPPIGSTSQPVRYNNKL